MFCRIRQVASPVGRQVTLFCRNHEVMTLGTERSLASPTEFTCMELRMSRVVNVPVRG